MIDKDMMLKAFARAEENPPESMLLLADYKDKGTTAFVCGDADRLTALLVKTFNGIPQVILQAADMLLAKGKGE